MVFTLVTEQKAKPGWGVVSPPAARARGGAGAGSGTLPAPAGRGPAWETAAGGEGPRLDLDIAPSIRNVSKRKHSPTYERLPSCL